MYTETAGRLSSLPGCEHDEVQKELWAMTETVRQDET